MNYRVNPMDLIQMIKSGSNPQQLMMSILEQNMGNNNPMMANLMQLAKNNDTAAIEKFARNLAKESGVDFDKEFGNFRRNFGI
jgi:catalase (peroxidase I)